MRIRIDWDLCQGHGTCATEAPEVFRLNEAGELEVLIDEPPEDMRTQVRAAVRYCPTTAISIEEGDAT